MPRQVISAEFPSPRNDSYDSEAAVSVRTARWGRFELDRFEVGRVLRAAAGGGTAGALSGMLALPSVAAANRLVFAQRLPTTAALFRPMRRGGAAGFIFGAVCQGAAAWGASRRLRGAVRAHAIAQGARQLAGVMRALAACEVVGLGLGAVAGEVALASFTLNAFVLLGELPFADVNGAVAACAQVGAGVGGLIGVGSAAAQALMPHGQTWQILRHVAERSGVFVWAQFNAMLEQFVHAQFCGVLANLPRLCVDADILQLALLGPRVGTLITVPATLAFMLRSPGAPASHVRAQASACATLGVVAMAIPSYLGLAFGLLGACTCWLRAAANTRAAFDAGLRGGAYLAPWFGLLVGLYAIERQGRAPNR